MKAIVISALLFFSLKAMSSEVEVGENKKSECLYANQSLERKPKIVIEDEAAKDVAPAKASSSKSI